MRKMTKELQIAVATNQLFFLQKTLLFFCVVGKVKLWVLREEFKQTLV